MTEHQRPLIPANEHQAYLLGQIEHTMAAFQFVTQVFQEQGTGTVDVYDDTGEIRFSADEQMRGMLAGGVNGLVNELVYEIGDYVKIENPDVVAKTYQEHVVFDGNDYQIYTQKENRNMNIAASDIIVKIKHSKFDYERKE